jgi:cobalt-zinc-cadmium efflux system protein
MTHTQGHQHTHEHQPDLKGKKLLYATALNLVITLAEVAGGLLSNSLALLSDAIHNLGDTFAIMLAYVANFLSKRDANEKKTFGYKRVEILAALLNAVILIAITLFLFIEAFKRLKTPEPVAGAIMFWVALVGLAANLVSVLLLKNEAHHNLNIRAAYLHLLGDTISSVAVIAGSILIVLFKIYWVDPVITFLIGIYILKEAYVVMKEAVQILMQGTPASIDLQEVVTELQKLESVRNIHHVHAWTLDDKQIHFECHADLLDDLPISKADKIRTEMESLLKNKFDISHVTIQFEYNCCDQKNVIHR